ncbi:MAG: hypothetical protein SNF33_00160 (plasmid) [Candidatus Algichlamydia australiensis]|nr:hypothetical protein [Chlamydiales bacterium]
MVFSEFFRKVCLFLLIPSVFLHAVPQSASPGSCISSLEDPIRKSYSFTTLDKLLVDDVLNFIDAIEKGAIVPSNLRELELLQNMVVNFARNGVLSSDFSTAGWVEQDIYELFNESSDNDWYFDYSEYGFENYGSFSGNFEQDREFLLCSSGISKKWKKAKSFVRKHKAAIIAGAVIVVAIVVVVVVTGESSSVGTVATGVGSVLAASQSDDVDPETSQHESSYEKYDVELAESSHLEESDEFIKKLAEEKIELFKEEVRNEIESKNDQEIRENPERSFKESLKNLGSVLSHEILDGAAKVASTGPELAEEIDDIGRRLFHDEEEVDIPLLFNSPKEKFKDWLAAAHEKIDEVFSTEAASSYTEEAKRARADSGLVISELPPPGSCKVGRIAPTQASSIRGWKVGDPINNLTRAGKVPKWSTVRKRYWKNEAFAKGAEYELENVKRMKKGLAPRRFNDDLGKAESMELHHIPPQKEGGLFDVIPLWPEEHAKVDPNRYTGK